MGLKKIHRIYFGFDGKADPYLSYLKTWKKQLPEYEIVYWTADDLPIANCYFSQLMFDLKDHAFLSDYFRWWILKEHGGIYLDADTEIVDGHIFNQLVQEVEDHPRQQGFIGIDNRSGGWYTAHTMGMKRQSEMAQFMCEVYENLGSISLWRRKIFYMMAPQLAALYFASRGHNVDGMGSSPNLDTPIELFGIKIFPQEYFSPLTPSEIVGEFIVDSKTVNTCVCHHFSCSWHDIDSPYRRMDRNELLLADVIRILGDSSTSRSRRSAKVKELFQLGQVGFKKAKKIILK